MEYTNFSESKSIYLQIGDIIENNILRGSLLENEKIPSTNEISKAYNINPATAAKGINLLVDEGILYKKRGIGMFVSEGGRQKIISKRKAKFYKNFVIPIIAESNSLNISEIELIQMIQKATSHMKEGN